MNKSPKELDNGFKYMHILSFTWIQQTVDLIVTYEEFPEFMMEIHNNPTALGIIPTRILSVVEQLSQRPKKEAYIWLI